MSDWKPEPTVNTSPPTPRFTDEPWRDQPAVPLAADLSAELRALKAKLASGAPSGVPVDPEAERRYLAACAARPRVGPLAGARPHDPNEAGLNTQPDGEVPF
jgi:hypothetical protein